MKNRSPFRFATLLLWCLPLCCSAPAWASVSTAEQVTLSRITLPGQLTLVPEKKIVIAIVDDGIRTTHQDLREFIWKSPFEAAGNLTDDDGNGFVDDTSGWDVADNNSVVAPPVARLEEFYHGTHLAGIVVQVARAAYGEKAPEAIAILPVKSLADDAPNTAIRHGYQGIEYAVRAGADIILCAWSVGHISSDEIKILQKAKAKGALVVAAAGNFPDENEMYPGAEESVFAVAALNNSSKVSDHSNYGTFVDLSAPGEEINSASALSDTAYAIHGGTSQATAFVVGAAAVMMAQNPTASNEQIRACLKNASSPLTVESTEHNAKHGAGGLNLSASLDCMTSGVSSSTFRRPQGYLDLSLAKTGEATWVIDPPGNFKGLWFTKPDQQSVTSRVSIDFFKGNKVTDEPFASFPLNGMPEKFFIPGTSALVRVKAEGEMPEAEVTLMEYRAEAIKYRSLYCRDTVYRYEPGSFDDGSSDDMYSANSSCKWLITAPKEQLVHFKFNEFDTEPKTDFLYFFNGSGTHEQIMAKFSGPDIPPEFISWSNKVLVWFVTNGENQGQGWQGEFTFVDKDKVVFPFFPKSPEK